METFLPDLPFPYSGVEIEHDADYFEARGPCPPYNSSESNLTTVPTTNLSCLKEWQDFSSDIDIEIKAAMERNNRILGTQLTVDILVGEKRKVGDKMELRIRAAELLDAVEHVLEMLGVHGRFHATCAGSAIVGNPGVSWICGNRTKLVAEYRAEWDADLRDLHAFFTKPHESRSENEKNGTNALQQLYGYMVFNDIKYGILSCWERAWFLRRPEPIDSGTLEYAGPINISEGTPSMLKAWVGITLLTERDWICPTTKHMTLALVRTNENTTANALHPANGSYPRHNLDLHACKFDLTSVRRSHRAVFRSELHHEDATQPPLDVLCKVSDVMQDPSSRKGMENEVDIYAALYDLQGEVIPKLHGYFTLWNIVDILALEHVGEGVPNEGEISPNTVEGMKVALGRIHDGGFIHGDVDRSNFCIRGGKVFLVDLESCEHSSDEEKKQNELAKVDRIAREDWATSISRSASL